MNAITTTSNSITAGTLQQSLFVDFIAYIDRGEKTTRTYLTNLRQFIKWLDANGITAPTRADVIAYRDYLTTQHKPNTVKLYLQSVSCKRLLPEHCSQRTRPENQTGRPQKRCAHGGGRSEHRKQHSSKCRGTGCSCCR